MTKKLEGNGLWVSSRMMLPQQRERVIEHRKQENFKSKPILHEDEWEIIAQNLRMSLNYTLVASIELFHERGNKYVKGIVTSVKDFGKKVKVETDTGFETLDYDQMVSVKLEEGDMDYEADC